MFKSKHSGWTWELKRTPFGGGGGAMGGLGAMSAAAPSAGSQGMMGGKSSGAGQGGYGGAPGFEGATRQDMSTFNQPTAQNQPSFGQSPYGMPPSSVNSTTQQDMMGGNRGSGQSFGQTMQGLRGGKSSGLGQGGYGGAPGFGGQQPGSAPMSFDEFKQNSAMDQQYRTPEQTAQLQQERYQNYLGQQGGMGGQTNPMQAQQDMAAQRAMQGFGGGMGGYGRMGGGYGRMGGQQGNIGLGGFNGTFSPEALAFQQANPQNAETNRMAQNAFTGMQGDMTRQSNNMAQNPQYTQGMGSLGGFGQQGMGGQQQIPNFGGQQQQMQQGMRQQQQFNPYQQRQQFNPYQQQQQFNPYQQQQQFNPYQQQQQQFGGFGQQQQPQDLRGLSQLLSFLRGY
jgi:hypothetical protein